MDLREKKLTRIVELVLEGTEIRSPADVSLLNDAEILRVPGIGRAGLKLLRDAYPVDEIRIENLAQIAQEERLRARQERVASGEQFIRKGAIVRVGVFHKVVAVKLGASGVVIQQRGAICLMPIKPAFDPIKLEFKTIGVEGEFGCIREDQNPEILRGIQPEDIVEMEISVDFIDKGEDFHTRLMRLKTSDGARLEWELFCDGRYSD